MLTNQKCISLATAEEVTYHCNVNANASASSTKSQRNNNACNPLNKVPTRFMFQPNDTKMEYTIEFSDR